MKKNHLHPVVVIDLRGQCDYNAYFSQRNDPDIKLNIKGPFAFLLWTFKAFKKTVDEDAIYEVLVDACRDSWWTYFTADRENSKLFLPCLLSSSLFIFNS